MRLLARLRSYNSTKRGFLRLNTLGMGSILAPLFVWHSSKYGEAVALFTIPVAYLAAYMWSAIWWRLGIGVARPGEQSMMDTSEISRGTRELDE